MDPRNIKIQPGWNVRDMNSPDTREWITTLKAAILTAGYDQTKPISVRYDIKTGIATLVDGQCRLTACKELREEGNEILVPCVVTNGDEAELTAESMAGNAGRALTQWEIGAGKKRLLRFGWTTEKIAAYICKPLRYVTEAIALSNVSIEAKTMLAKGEVTPGAVLNAVKTSGPDAAAEVLQVQVAEKKAKAPAGEKPKPVSRPKKPSAKEKIANTVPTILDLADKLARMVVDEDQSIDKVIAAARAYLKARGI
jgi:ParB-like chromosome segregation protein Spo0J